jgi:hypothetical protein
MPVVCLRLPGGGDIMLCYILYDPRFRGHIGIDGSFGGIVN